MPARDGGHVFDVKKQAQTLAPLDVILSKIDCHLSIPGSLKCHCIANIIHPATD